MNLCQNKDFNICVYYYICSALQCLLYMFDFWNQSHTYSTARLSWLDEKPFDYHHDDDSKNIHSSICSLPLEELTEAGAIRFPPVKRHSSSMYRLTTITKRYTTLLII